MQAVMLAHRAEQPEQPLRAHVLDRNDQPLAHRAQARGSELEVAEMSADHDQTPALGDRRVERLLVLNGPAHQQLVVAETWPAQKVQVVERGCAEDATRRAADTLWVAGQRGNMPQVPFRAAASRPAERPGERAGGQRQRPRDAQRDPWDDPRRYTHQPIRDHAAHPLLVNAYSRPLISPTVTCSAGAEAISLAFSSVSSPSGQKRRNIAHCSGRRRISLSSASNMRCVSAMVSARLSPLDSGMISGPALT